MEELVVGTGGAGGVRIMRAPAGCDAINTTTSPYDPAWMPDGWKAFEYSYSQFHFCTTTDAGPIEVDYDSYNATRLQLVAVLDSLRYQNTTQPTYTPTPTTDDGSGTYTPTPTDDGGGSTPTPTSYKPPRKPMLPFPLDLQLQTLKIGENGRGWGGRLGLPLSKALGEKFLVTVRGEVGYDTETKLAYDVGGNLGWFLTSGLSVDGNLGYDRIGTGDNTAISGALYYGIGGGWATYADDHALSLKLFYDWRSVPSDAAMTMDPTYPDHEWRFRGAYNWGGNGVIDGIDLEYRDIGDASSFLAGLSLRL
jgi:hypothetical protein